MEEVEGRGGGGHQRRFAGLRRSRGRKCPWSQTRMQTGTLRRQRAAEWPSRPLRGVPWRAWPTSSHHFSSRLNFAFPMLARLSRFARVSAAPLARPGVARYHENVIDHYEKPRNVGTCAAGATRRRRGRRMHARRETAEVVFRSLQPSLGGPGISLQAPWTRTTSEWARGWWARPRAAT